MKKIRPIKRLLSGDFTREGAGVRLRRLFGQRDVPLFDPYLLLEDFHSSHQRDYLKGFPWHPHRGIETITYMHTGTMQHTDSLGYKGKITEGDLLWMTAGSGVIHQEMLLGNRDLQLGGIQLWANIPSGGKLSKPCYQYIGHAHIPVAHVANTARMRIIAGRYDTIHGPVKNEFIDPVFFDVALSAEAEFVYRTPPEHTLFAYVLEGYGLFGLPASAFQADISVADRYNGLLRVNERSVALYSEGEIISIATTDSPVRFLLIGGKPIREPVAWYGPVVMNSDEELKTAFEEFQIGTFLKHHMQTVH